MRAVLILPIVCAVLMSLVDGQERDDFRLIIEKWNLTPGACMRYTIKDDAVRIEKLSDFRPGEVTVVFEGEVPLNRGIELAEAIDSAEIGKRLGTRIYRLGMDDGFAFRFWIPESEDYFEAANVRDGALLRLAEIIDNFLPDEHRMRFADCMANTPDDRIGIEKLTSEQSGARQPATRQESAPHQPSDP